MKKHDIKSQEFQEAFLELRNTPREDGLSTNQRLFGKNLRSRIPAHYKVYDQSWWNIIQATDDKKEEICSKSKSRYDSRSRPLSPFNVENHVRIQNPSTKRWTHTGTIMKKGQRRDYWIKLPSGRLWRRNRRFLRIFYNENENIQAESEKAFGFLPRRSARTHVPVKRYMAWNVVSL